MGSSYPRSDQRVVPWDFLLSENLRAALDSDSRILLDSIRAGKSYPLPGRLGKQAILYYSH